LLTVDLDFETLDDLSLAVQRGKISGNRQIAIRGFAGLGPLVEFGLDRAGDDSRFSMIRSIASRELETFVSVVQSRQPEGGKRNNGQITFFPTMKTAADQFDDDRWLEFRYSAQRSAEKAGVPKRAAQGIVGAIDELTSNIYEHSEFPETGIVAHQTSSAGFEFAIADRGIGVLQSLRSCAEFSRLSDSGEALRLALLPGYSRFGINVGRGFGFRTLFLTLAGMNGLVRFRIDNYALTLEGRAARLESARIVQKADFRGFCISVLCRKSS
jgi:hypothetical protein